MSLSGISCFKPRFHLIQFPERLDLRTDDRDHGAPEIYSKKVVSEFKAHKKICEDEELSSAPQSAIFDCPRFLKRRFHDQSFSAPLTVLK